MPLWTSWGTARAGKVRRPQARKTRRPQGRRVHSQARVCLTSAAGRASRGSAAATGGRRAGAAGIASRTAIHGGSCAGAGVHICPAGGRRAASVCRRIRHVRGIAIHGRSSRIAAGRRAAAHRGRSIVPGCRIHLILIRGLWICGSIRIGSSGIGRVIGVNHGSAIGRSRRSGAIGNGGHDPSARNTGPVRVQGGG